MRLLSVLLAVIMMSCATTTSVSDPELSSISASAKIKHAKLNRFVGDWARGFEMFLASRYNKTVKIEILEYCFLDNSRLAIVRALFDTISEQESVAILVISKDVGGKWSFITLVPISTIVEAGGQDEEL